MKRQHYCPEFAEGSSSLVVTSLYALYAAQHLGISLLTSMCLLFVLLVKEEQY
jgi:hypothetical protein